MRKASKVWKITSEHGSPHVRGIIYNEKVLFDIPLELLKHFFVLGAKCCTSMGVVIHDGTAVCPGHSGYITSNCKPLQAISSRLRNIQISLGNPQHRLLQDATRWNSTLYMLQSITEQKMALAAYAAECSDLPQLSPHQLNIIEKIIAVLRPIEDITKSISSDKASVSIIIPFVRALQKSLETIVEYVQ